MLRLYRILIVVSIMLSTFIVAGYWVLVKDNPVRCNDILRVMLFLMAALVFIFARILFILAQKMPMVRNFMLYIAPLFAFLPLFFIFLGIYSAKMYGKRRELIPFYLISVYYTFRFYKPIKGG